MEPLYTPCETQPEPETEYQKAGLKRHSTLFFALFYGLGTLTFVPQVFFVNATDKIVSMKGSKMFGDVTSVPSKDSKLIFLFFYALGTLTHVPQNFYITANDYWMYKFRDPTASGAVDANFTRTTEKTQFQKNFTSSYTIVANVCMVGFLILTVVNPRRISLQRRIVASLSAMLLLFIITLIFIKIDTDSWQNVFFVISLIIGGLLNASGGCFLISVFQLASKFPPAYLTAQLAGQAICGILAALVQIMTLLIGSSSDVSAFIYFSIGAVFILTIHILYLTVLSKVDYFQEQLQKEEEEEEEKVKLDISKVKKVAYKLMPIMVTMVLTAGSSVMVYPGMLSLIESQGHGKWSEVFFVPVCTFLLYSSFDFIGRECSLRWMKFSNINATLIAAVIRLLFIPLLMFCNIQPRNHLPVVFREDYLYIILVIIFAFTSGYLVNICVLEIPSVCEPDERKISIFLIILVMVVSLSTCSFLSGALVNSI